MLRYALNRLFWTIPVVLVAITIAFFLVRATGGSPFRHGPLIGLTSQYVAWTKYGDYQPKSTRDNMNRRYGLDLPWYEQYANYVAGIATFSLGPSLSYRNRTVDDVIRTQGPITLELGGLALILASSSESRRAWVPPSRAGRRSRRWSGSPPHSRSRCPPSSSPRC